MLTANRNLKCVRKVAPVRDRRSYLEMKVQLQSFVKLALVVSFIPQPLNPVGKRYRYTVNRRQIRPQELTESSNIKDLREDGHVSPGSCGLQYCYLLSLLATQNYQRDALNIIYSSNIITLLYIFRVSSTHLQEDIVVHKQHMVPSLSIRVLVSC